MKSVNNKLLRINLTTGEHSDFPVGDEVYRKYIGGRALGARLLYDLLPPHIDPLSEKNILIFLLGPVTGTIVPGASKFVVITRSPATGTFLDSYSSGKLAIELKMAGYDGLILEGKAQRPSYLYINDDDIQIRDAGFLWGMDSYEAERALEKLLGSEFGFSTIGPAGERLVKIACINSDLYRQAARGGVGAVMGSKNLKALAIRGTKSIEVANPQGMMDKVSSLFEHIAASKVAQNRMRFGTPMTMNITNSAGMLPTRNFQTGVMPEAADNIDGPGVEKLTIKTRGCYACTVACGKVTKVPKGDMYEDTLVEGPEYESASLLGSNLGISYLPSVIKSNELCDRLGIDTISAGALVSFTMECFERGILTEEDIGYPIKFGDIEHTQRLIEDIAYRRGIGNILAEGSRNAANIIGKNSIKYAMQVKNLEFPGYDPRAAFGAGLAYAVSPRGACHRRAWPPAKEVLGNYLPHTVLTKAEMVKGLYDDNCVYHTILICDCASKFIPLEVADYCSMMKYTTGEELSAKEALKIADMAETLIRMFNVREGFSRKDDTLPGRILNETHPEGPSKGKCIGQEGLDYMLSEYYKLRGWDDNGVPTKETIEKYGL